MKKQIQLITFLSILAMGLFFARQSLAQTAYPISPFIFTTPSPMIGPIVPSSSFKLPSLGTASSNNFVRVNSNGVFFTGGVSSTPSTTPGGSNTQVQVNENGAFAGYPNFTFNSSTGLLDVSAISSTNALFINASSTNLFASALIFTTANGTSITSTNAFFTNLGSTNFSVTNISATSINATNANITNLTSTNIFVTSSRLINVTATTITTTNLNFTSASGTSITSTNGYFNNVYINTTTQLATVSLQGVAPLDLFKAMSSTGGQLFAIKANGQVVVGPNDLAQTGALTIQSQPGNDITLSFTDGVNYTFQLGRVAGTSGQAFIGGPFGTALNLRAGGTDRVFIRNDTGFVGINSSTPSTQLVVVGTTTLNGFLDFATASGTSITSTNAFFTNLSATTLNLTNLIATSITSTNLSATTANLTSLAFGTATGTSITSTNAFFTNLRATTLNLTNLVATNMTSTNGNISALTFTTATGTSITSTNAYFSNLTAATTLVTFLNATSLTSTNGYIPSLMFVSATGTNFFATNTRFINATTTNIQITGQLVDSTGSAGNFGDILISTSTGNKWTNLGAACTPGSGDCTVVDNASWFIISGGTGCPENSIIIKDDSTYTCDNDFIWDRTSYAVKRLVINGDISFLNATGTSANFSDTVSTSILNADTINTNNLTINNNITVNNLTVNTAATIANSTTINSTGIRSNNFFIDYIRPVDGSSLLKPILDPDILAMQTAVANTQAFYTDDISRTLVCSNVTSTGALSLKNSNLTPANSGNSAFYDNTGNLQTITANSLCGGATYAIRGCITTGGYHAVLCVATSTAPTVFVKITTSSPAVNIANAAVWRTANFTVATPTINVIGLVGVTKATGSDTLYLEFVSTTTKIVPATFTFSASTASITPDNTLTCTTAGSATIQNTRAFYGGFVIGNSSAPFLTVYHNCGSSSENGQWGQAAPSLTGPDLFVTKCSVYSLQGSLLFRHSGYTGC